MLLRSASSPLLNRARAPAEHLAVPSSAARHQGAAALCRAVSEGDLAGPLVAAAVRGGGNKDEGRGHGRAPTPLSASSAASFSVEEEEDEEREYEEEEEDDDVVAAAAAAPVPLRRLLLTSTGLESSSSPALVADAHYRRMIASDPANSLLLGNYARFLKHVEGDAARAQEYCERAILANPADAAEALSLYAGLVWDTARDAARADAYYSRAVQAAPDDCYVLASYAAFLWDAEEDDEESDNTEPMPPPSPFLDAAAQPPSVTVPS